MTSISRRDAGKVLLAGAAGLLTTEIRLPGADKVNSVIRGVAIGSQSYSFRDLKTDDCIQAFRTVGLGECELSPQHVEPEGLKGAALDKWRLSAPLSYFEQARKKWDDAGVHVHAYAFAFRHDMSDAEMERGFLMAKALGVNMITSSANVSVAPRVDKFASKYKMRVGFHGHDQTEKPDEFSTAETFARAMRGASEYICVNLDIGHFTAANGDAVEYIKQHHDRIVTLHIKDRKKNHGANLPFGQGDTPIGPVLRLLRDNKWKIYANIEYEYGDKAHGFDTLTEMKKCYAYCKKELMA